MTSVEFTVPILSRPLDQPWLPICKEGLLLLSKSTSLQSVLPLLSSLAATLPELPAANWMRSDKPIQQLIWHSFENLPWYQHLLHSTSRITVEEAASRLLNPTDTLTSSSPDIQSELCVLLPRLCASFHAPSSSLSLFELDTMLLILRASFAPHLSLPDLSSFLGQLFDTYLSSSLNINHQPTSNSDSSSSSSSSFFAASTFSSTPPLLHQKLDLLCLCNVLWRNPLILDLFDFAVDYHYIMGDDGLIPYFLGDLSLPLSRAQFVAQALPLSRASATHLRLSLSHQTGGHIDRFFRVDDAYLKKLTTRLEADFYRLKRDGDPSLSPLFPFVPAVRDVAEDGAIKSSARFGITIEDLTREFQRPCVLDLKVGTSSLGPDTVDPKKLAQQGARDAQSTSAALGLRIVGYITHAAVEQPFDASVCTKSEGRLVAKENFHLAVARFFSADLSRLPERVPLLRGVRDEVEALAAVLRAHSVVEMFSTSILITYDAESASAPVFRVKMIDFGHWFRLEQDRSPTDGYVLGLDNLILVLQFLIDHADTLSSSSDHHLIPNYMNQKR